MKGEHYAFLGTIVVGFWLAVLSDVKPFTDEAGYWFIATVLFSFKAMLKVRDMNENTD